MLARRSLHLARALPRSVTLSAQRAFSTPANSTIPDDRPLSGIKVVDLTRVLAGPSATMMLVSMELGDDANFSLTLEVCRSVS